MTTLFVLRRVDSVARQVVWTIRQEWRAAVGGLRRGRGRVGAGPLFMSSLPAQLGCRGGPRTTTRPAPSVCPSAGVTRG